MFLTKFLPSLFLYYPPQSPLTDGVDLLVNVTGPATVTPDDFKITTILSNNGDKDVTLLNHPNSILTPSFKTNIFGIVSKHGTPAKFGGIYLKWTEEIAIANKDFTVLKAGQSLEITQDLSGIYDFSQGDSKSYTIDSASTFQLVHRSGEITDYLAYVDPLHVKVTGSLAPKTGPAPPRPQGTSFQGCTTAQQDEITPGITQANAYIAEAQAYLKGLNATSPRYQTWFGAWNVDRKKIVASHFKALAGDPSRTTYDCSTCPTEDIHSAFAYVHANDPTTVFLCDAFWPAPVSGTDSKGGTIVHEQSHFTNNGGTQDYAYGHSLAQQLAKNNPKRAIMNADSHEYFAENTPHLA